MSKTMTSWDVINKLSHIRGALFWGNYRSQLKIKDDMIVIDPSWDNPNIVSACLQKLTEEELYVLSKDTGNYWNSYIMDTLENKTYVVLNLDHLIDSVDKTHF